MFTRLVSTSTPDAIEGDSITAVTAAAILWVLLLSLPLVPVVDVDVLADIGSDFLIK